MRVLVVTALAAALTMVPATARSALDPATDEPEGCQAFNPGQPTCTFTATTDAETPISGALGVGSWVVKVKRAGEKKPITLKGSPDGAPSVSEFTFQEGDVVKAKALSAGTFMTVGFVQE